MCMRCRHALFEKANLHLERGEAQAAALLFTRSAAAFGKAAKAGRATQGTLLPTLLSNLGNALKAAPDSPNNLEMDARAMLHTGLYADVIQTTGRLLKVKPSSLEGFLLRGQAYLYQGEEELAMQHFTAG